MQNAEPIVHIGFPKSATTWFQKAFYPHVRGSRYIERSRVNSAFLETNALTFDPVRAREALGLAEGEAGILSEEGLCGYLHNGGVAGIVTKEVADRIRRTLGDARIVIFLRSQPRILVAAYQQYVRAGGTFSARRYFFPNDYLADRNAVTYKQPRFDVDFFRYGPVIGLYDDLFGRERVHVFLFEQFQQGGMEFLREYARILHLDVDWDAVAAQPRLPSYGPALTALARFLNLFSSRAVMDKRMLFHIPYWHQPRRRILERLNRTGLFGRPPTLERLVGRETAHWLERHYADDNVRLAQQRGLPLAEYGYPMDVDDPTERPKPARWKRQLSS